MAKAALQSESRDNRPSAGKIVKKILDVFLTVILLTAIITAVYIFQNKKTNGQVQIAGYRLYVVLSGSMSPTFDTGSAVIVKTIDPKDIVTGDIITFMGATNTGKTITHRIVAIDSTGGELSFTTKGDANNTADSSPLYPEDVIGKVQFSIPYIGYFLEFSKTKEGIYFLIILPSIVIILLEARNIFVWMTEKKRQKAMADKAAKLERMKTDSDAGTQRPNEPIKVIEEAIANQGAAGTRTFAANPPRTAEAAIPSPAVKIPDFPAAAVQIPDLAPMQTPDFPAAQSPNLTAAQSPDLPTAQSPDLPAAQSPTAAKPEPPADSVAKAAQDLLCEAQTRSTQKIYQTQVEAEETIREMQRRLDSLYREEEDLDRMIRQKTDRIIERLKQ